MLVGPELKKWREAHGLTLAQLADEIGVTWNTIIRWEMPEDTPSKRRPTRLTRPMLERAIQRIEKRRGKMEAA